jgi:periplasmic divalent cation tolerance protein
MSDEVRVVFCTFPDPETAHRISQAAVEKRYAACASLVPAVRSIYRWRDQVQQADEALVVYKTSAACYPDLEEFLLRSHPYEVPEIVALPISAGSAAYLDWVIDSSGPEMGA